MLQQFRHLVAPLLKFFSQGQRLVVVGLRQLAQDLTGLLAPT